MPPSAARRSTFAIFALNGFLLGMWVVHIPEIRERTGASTAVLGYLLLLLGGTALLGMQVGGRLIDRFGSRVVAVVAGLALSVCLVGPGLATSTPALAVALGLLGVFNGVIDVAQNAQAVEVERAYGRPIISGVPRVLLPGRPARVAGRRRADRARLRRPADPRRRRRARHPRHARRPARAAPAVAGHDPRARRSARPCAVVAARRRSCRCWRSCSCCPRASRTTGARSTCTTRSARASRSRPGRSARSRSR